MTSVRLALVVFLTAAGVAGAQPDPIGHVRELYANAAYEEALTAVARVKGDVDPASAALELDRYRAMCLIALGRSAEAETVIEGIVTAAPLYQLTADASPRVVSMFASVRRRVLPTVIRGLYADAKRAFDRKAFVEAAEKLSQTLRVIDDPDARDLPDGSDLRTLTSGFLDLSRASLAAVSSSPAPRPVPAASRTPPEAAAALPSSDPIVIRQDVPPWSRAIGGALFEAEFKGAIEVDIDEQGGVVAARILESIHPSYDPILLKASRSWKYEPARRAGSPVPARKRVDIVLRPR